MVALRNMSQLTTQAIFPKEVLVFSVVLARSIEFGFGLLISILFAYISGVAFSWSILAVPVIFFLQMLLVLWVSLVLSWTYLIVRDIQHIYQAFLRLLLFMSPIFYSLSFLDNNPLAKQVILWNPLTHIINYARQVVLNGELFPLPSVIGFAVINVLLLYGGYALFKRVEPKFTELI
jgi:ABC-2 type transport system permease protein